MTTLEPVMFRRPNPVRLRRALRLNEVDFHRRVGCLNYRRCLDGAAGRSWLSFTCVRCFAFRPRFEPAACCDAYSAAEWLATGVGNRLFPDIALYLAFHRAPDRS